MTRAELMSRISDAEFYEWMVLEQIEPFGEFAEWVRNGRLLALLSNIYRSKDDPPYKLYEFLPPVMGEEMAPKQSPEHLFKAFQLLMAAQNKQTDA